MIIIFKEGKSKYLYAIKYMRHTKLEKSLKKSLDYPSSFVHIKHLQQMVAYISWPPEKVVPKLLQILLYNVQLTFYFLPL